MENQESTKVSKEYLKAYNQADMICTYMPHLLKGMTIPGGEPSEYTKGFQERINQYEQEKKMLKKLQPDLFKKETRAIDKERSNIDRDRTK